MTSAACIIANITEQDFMIFALFLAYLWLINEKASIYKILLLKKGGKKVLNIDCRSITFWVIKLNKDKRVA